MCVPSRFQSLELRENTEGAYMLGSHGVMIDNELAIDFRVITAPGAGG